MSNGFSTLIILIAATILLAIFGGGTYYFQHQQSLAPATPSRAGKSATPYISPNPSSDSTPSPTPSPSSNPSPTTAPQPLSFAQAIQPTCTSASCGNTTALTIYGSGFSKNTQLSATGQVNGNPYSGQLTQVSNDGKQINFDLQGLLCQTYTAALTNPGSAVVSFTFYPGKCN
jgi:cytoskeletal protein RodZ